MTSLLLPTSSGRALAEGAPRLAPARPLRIGIYESSTGPGGPSRYVNALLAAATPGRLEFVVFAHPQGPYKAAPGVDIVSIAPGDPPTAGREDAEHRPNSANGPSPRRFVRRLMPRSLKLWAGFTRDARRLAQLFARHPVDLLHTNNTGCEESAVAARWAGIPRVLGTFHVDSTYDLDGARSGPAHRILECVSNHCLHRSIAVSEATRQDWVRRTWLPRRRVVTIHNGIDVEQVGRRHTRRQARRLLGLPDGPALLIGGVGRLDPAKGFSDLIDAVALLAPACPQLRLVLAGQGALRPVLEAQVAALGLADRVTFLGFQSNVQLVYDSLDIFVLCSLCETLGYVLLEAMATQLPVVITRVGGMPEVVNAPHAGLQVEPRNPQALAKALRQLIDAPALRRQIGKAGRARVVQDFRQARMVAETLRLYHDMAGR